MATTKIKTGMIKMIKTCLGVVHKHANVEVDVEGTHVVDDKHVRASHRRLEEAGHDVISVSDVGGSGVENDVSVGSKVNRVMAEFCMECNACPVFG
jgi:hypothetical protein